MKAVFEAHLTILQEGERWKMKTCFLSPTKCHLPPTERESLCDAADSDCAAQLSLACSVVVQGWVLFPLEHKLDNHCAG